MIPRIFPRLYASIHLQKEDKVSVAEQDISNYQAIAS